MENFRFDSANKIIQKKMIVERRRVALKSSFFASDEESCTVAWKQTAVDAETLKSIQLKPQSFPQIQKNLHHSKI